MQGASQNKMDEDLTSGLGCWPINPRPSPCSLGHVPLLSFSTAFHQLFRQKPLWASLYVHAQQSPFIKDPHSPSTSTLAKAIAAAEGIQGIC